MRKFFSIIFICCVSLLYASEPVYTLNEQWVTTSDGIKLLDPYYNVGVTFTWEGPTKGGKAHGIGTAKKYMQGKLESTYEGEYRNGVREGNGTFTHADGTVRKGTFVKGQMTGYGIMEAENGDSYEGEFINYRMHGKGKGKWGNGSTFEGFWVTDAPYTGKFTNYNGDFIYIEAGEPVEMLSNQISSYSPKLGSKQTEYFDEHFKRTDNKNASYYRVITYEAPNKPKGVVKDYYMNGKLQGEADFIYVDYVDEGKNFKEGRMTTYYPSGKLQSDALYLNNRLNGPQTIYFEDGNVQSKLFYNNGEPEGTQITYYQNGNPNTVAVYDNGELYGNKVIQFSEDGEGCVLVYSENFNRNRENWESHSVNGNLEINPNNSITFDVTPDRMLSGGFYTDYSPNVNNIVEVTTRRDPYDKNVAIGLLFGYKDWNNYCGFYICGKEFKYMQIINGKQVTNYDWEYSEAIQPEINEIAVTNLGDELSFAINEQEIATIKRPQYAGGFSVLTVANNGMKEAVVDAAGLSVYEFIDPNLIAEYLPLLPDGYNNNNWKGTGSGFFINENGLIATNYHVIDGMDSIEVIFGEEDQKRNYPAAVVLSDKDNDLAILKIESPDFHQMPSIPYNFMTGVKDTGSEVFALGYPLTQATGEEIKFTDGKISAKSGFRGDKRFYQISVPIQHGNSGGPLFDNEGNLVGITSSGLNREYYDSENVNYAIKSSLLKSLIDTLPQQVSLQTKSDIAPLPLTEKIKKFEPYVILIKVK